MPPKQARSAETLQRILSATVDLIERRPYCDITMAEIAAAAHTSPPSIYARFENKEALLLGVYQQLQSEVRAELQDAYQPDKWSTVSPSKIIDLTVEAVAAAHQGKASIYRSVMLNPSDELLAESARTRRLFSRSVADVVVPAVVGTDVAAGRSPEAIRRRVDLACFVLISVLNQHLIYGDYYMASILPSVGEPDFVTTLREVMRSLLGF